MSPPVPLTPEAWARIRYEYEHTKRPVDDIALEHGISAGTLRDRVRRWGWTPRWGAIPVNGPPAVVVPQLEFHPPETAADSPEPDMAPLGPRFRGDERKEDEPSPHLSDTRPIGLRVQGALAQVMPALETTLSSLAAGPMAPRQMELAARALGSLTRTLRELNGLVTQHGARGYHDDPIEDEAALRAQLIRQIDSIVAQEREDLPRRYLAGWEEFAAQAAAG